MLTIKKAPKRVVCIVCGHTATEHHSDRSSCKGIVKHADGDYRKCLCSRRRSTVENQDRP